MYKSTVNADTTTVDSIAALDLAETVAAIATAKREQMALTYRLQILDGHRRKLIAQATR